MPRFKQRRLIPSSSPHTVDMEFALSSYSYMRKRNINQSSAKEKALILRLV